MEYLKFLKIFIFVIYVLVIGGFRIGLKRFLMFFIIVLNIRRSVVNFGKDIDGGGTFLFIDFLEVTWLRFWM